jgi:uncharacterized DUF497 family protein
MPPIPLDSVLGKSLRPIYDYTLTRYRKYNNVYTEMRVSWDEPKSRSNRKKHGISFDTAAQVFLDPLHITRQDQVVEGEQRWQTIGMVDSVLLVLVAYAVVVDDDEEVIRIISARRVTRQERIGYEEASEI